MTHLMRSRNLELTVGLTDLERVFQLDKEEPSTSVQEKMPGDDEHYSMTSQVGAGNRFEDWLKNTGTVRGEDGAGKVQWRWVLTRFRYLLPFCFCVGL